MASGIRATSAATHPVGLDMMGLAASALCAVHCLVGPLILALAPAMGQFWTDPLTHWLIALVVLPVALGAVWRGQRVHGRRWLLPLTALAAGLILAGLLIPPLLGGDHHHGQGHHHHGTSLAHQMEIGLTVAGSALLLAVHGINLHGCLRGNCGRQCAVCDQAGQTRA